MNKLQIKKVQDRLAKYFDPALGQYDMDDVRVNPEDMSDEEKYSIYLTP